MSDTSPIPNPSRVIRFRLRTMLVATSVLAVLAAIAGPYYRSIESSTGRREVLLLWGLIAAGGLASLWKRWRESWQIADGRQLRLTVYARGQGRSGWRRTAKRSISVLVLLMLVWVYSEVAAIAWQGRLPFSFNPWRYLLSTPCIIGLALGSWTAALVYTMIPRPLFLCDEGIPLGRVTLAPWKYIRRAEWLPDKPGVMRLRRLDGDIYFDVPAEVRDKVEAFVRSKTTFVDVTTG